MKRSSKKLLLPLAALGLLVVHCKPANDPSSTARIGEPWFPDEPNYPSPCATLVATKTDKDGFLAPADENAPDTKSIQDALDGCAQGHSVRLIGENGTNAFLTGPLVMPDGITLWVDRGVTLYGSRNPRDYDVRPGTPTCGTEALDDSSGCKPLINVYKVSNVGLMGEGTIDGRGGEPMLGSTKTWWDVAQDAKVKKSKHSNPRIIDVKGAKKFTMYKLSILNSPKFHAVINAEGFMVWGVKVLTPSRPVNSVGRPLSAHYARNTDGIDPSSASNGYIVHSYISVGDDQIAIKAGNSGPTYDLTIAHNVFGTGHGMSIGSETNGGMARVHVYDLVIDGQANHGGMPKVDINGIRIKSDSSRGGHVYDVTYENLCMRDIAFPIILTPHYSKSRGQAMPVYDDITIRNVHAMWTGYATEFKPVVRLEGNDPDHVTAVRLDNVKIDGMEPGAVKAEFANVTLGPGPVSFPVSGPQQVKVDDQSSPAAAAAKDPCAGKFPASGPKP